MPGIQNYLTDVFSIDKQNINQFANDICGLKQEMFKLELRFIKKLTKCNNMIITAHNNIINHKQKIITSNTMIDQLLDITLYEFIKNIIDTFSILKQSLDAAKIFSRNHFLLLSIKQNLNIFLEQLEFLNKICNIIIENFIHITTDYKSLVKQIRLYKNSLNSHNLIDKYHINYFTFISNYTKSHDVANNLVKQIPFVLLEINNTLCDIEKLQKNNTKQ
jgi:hypothetical protein